MKTIAAIVVSFCLLIAGQAHAQNKEVFINNQSSDTILGVYGTPKGVTGWGIDLLGDQTLRSGFEIKIDFRYRGSSECVYDMKVVFAEARPGRDKEVEREINVCRVTRWTIRDRTNKYE